MPPAQGEPAAPLIRRLVLLRHARAEPEGPGSDATRPLTLAGRRAASAAGALLRAEGLVPDRVLVSGAVRTRQTWELVRSGLGDAAPDAGAVLVTDELYAARVATVLGLLQAVPDDVGTVLVVGHEPTMSGAAEAFSARTGDGEAMALRSQVQAGLSTAACAVLEVPSWSGLAPGAGVLRAVLRP